MDDSVSGRISLKWIILIIFTSPTFINFRARHWKPLIFGTRFRESKTFSIVSCDPFREWLRPTYLPTPAIWFHIGVAWSYKVTFSNYRPLTHYRQHFTLDVSPFIFTLMGPEHDRFHRTSLADTQWQKCRSDRGEKQFAVYNTILYRMNRDCGQGNAGETIIMFEFKKTRKNQRVL